MKKRLLVLLLFALGMVIVLNQFAMSIYNEKEVELLPLKQYLKQYESESDAYLLDIRTPMEYRQGHIPGAQNINYLGFFFNRKVKKLDNSKPVYIYCESAHRSPHVAKKLHHLGFEKIVDLKHGFRTYRASQSK